MTEVKKSEKTLKQKITDILKEEDKVQVDIFSSYMQKLLVDKDKDGALRNPWMKTKSPENLADLFKRVKNIGLEFDGVHVSLQTRGIALDYVAYKNKMLLAYPESKIDLGVVKEGDEFTLENINGEVVYRYINKDPFKTADVSNIVGAFCIIKNKRGEYATVLSKDEIAKRRAKANADFIWKAWYKEMVLKSVMRAGCKYHFDDIFEDINKIDNESFDLEKEEVPNASNEEVESVIKTIESFTDIKKLQSYFAGLEKKFIINGDVFEAYNAQKEVCKTTK